MFLDIILGVTFFGAISFFYYRILQRLPDLRAVPDDLILQRLHSDQSKFRLSLLHFKTLYKKKFHRVFIWNAIGIVLHKIHGAVRSLDKILIRVVAFVRVRYECAGGKNGTPWRDIEGMIKTERAGLIVEEELAIPTKNTDFGAITASSKSALSGDQKAVQIRIKRV